MGLLEQIQGNDLHHVDHAVVATNLFQLVEIVEDGVLRLVDLEHLRVGREERPHQVLRRNHALKVWLLL